MLVIAGFIIVLVATLGGFILAGGNPLVLVHVSEFVVIGGIAIGIVLAATPMATLKLTISQIIGRDEGRGWQQGRIFRPAQGALRMFNCWPAERGNRAGRTPHQPEGKLHLQEIPLLRQQHHRVDFLCNSLRPIVDGRIKPEQLDEVLDHDIAAKEEEAEGPIHVLQLIGDSLPGVGIVAAVLGLSTPWPRSRMVPAAVGESVAAALTGTFLGILAAYGFVNPLAARIKAEQRGGAPLLSRASRRASCSFANGFAPHHGSGNLPPLPGPHRPARPRRNGKDPEEHGQRRKPGKMAKKGGGHHGGAWKVAYADFVTAMMALFMVLWISTQNIEIRKATSKFFQDPYNALPERSSGMMNATGRRTRNDESHTDQTAPADMGYLQAIAQGTLSLHQCRGKGRTTSRSISRSPPTACGSISTTGLPSRSS
ncbi:MAG: flagellar motor protein MotB [Chthoniobacteraceae bacterium]